MRWKNFFFTLFCALIYTTLPLIISGYGKALKRIYGCRYDEFCNASTWCSFTKIECDINSQLANYIATLIDMGLFALFTVPTGLLAIILLVVVQIILKLVRKRRNRLNNRSSR